MKKKTWKVALALGVMTLGGCSDSTTDNKEDISTGEQVDKQANLQSALPEKPSIKVTLSLGEYRPKFEEEESSCLSNSGFKTTCLERDDWKSICDNAESAYLIAFSDKVSSQMYGASFNERMAFLEGAGVSISFKWDESRSTNSACRYRAEIVGTWQGTGINVQNSGKLSIASVESDGSVFGRELMTSE